MVEQGAFNSKVVGSIPSRHSNFERTMPHVDKKIYNVYSRNYMRERWARRRASAIQQLGGCCARCGVTDNLEFDHIDPSTKSFTIAKGSSASEVKFQAELEKCQLLCVECHKEKTYS